MKAKSGSLRSDTLRKFRPSINEKRRENQNGEGYLFRISFLAHEPKMSSNPFATLGYAEVSRPLHFFALFSYYYRQSPDLQKSLPIQRFWN